MAEAAHPIVKRTLAEATEQSDLADARPLAVA